MNLPYASPGQNAENAACAALVRSARTKCARALRQWRSTDKARARWFRSHMYRVGYPLKDSIR